MVELMPLLFDIFIRVVTAASIPWAEVGVQIDHLSCRIVIAEDGQIVPQPDSFYVGMPQPVMGSLHTVITGYLAYTLTRRFALEISNWVD